MVYVFSYTIKIEEFGKPQNLKTGAQSIETCG